MTIKLLLVFIAIMVNSTSSYAQQMQKITYSEQPRKVDSLKIHEGILSQHAMKIRYMRKGKSVAKITLSEPVMVAMANQEEQWGYFQFPTVGRAEDGTLIVTWQMRADSHTAYGKLAEKRYKPMMSKDGGITWVPMDKEYFSLHGNYYVKLKDGGILQIYTPMTKDIHSFEIFPQPVARKGGKDFYIADSLPDKLQGTFFNYWDKEKKTKSFHARIIDPGYLRYAIDGLMPVVWWENIKELSNNSLLAGIYPTYYRSDCGEVLPNGVTFYSSDDNGYTWKVKGKINSEKIDGVGFDEPSYEILSDSSLICVLRTGSVSPMYSSFSKDFGKTWSKPRPFTPNGVRPWLKMMENGVLILASGRPGVQLRFSFDGTGKNWSDSIDMLPFMNSDGTYNREVSCGYAAILELNKNSFLIVYSDFMTKNIHGLLRKSIWCRKVTVKTN